MHPDDYADELGDGYGSNTFARDHAGETITAYSSGRIGNKGIARDKAKPFVKNGMQAVLFGSPRYSDRDAVMGYDWSMVFVGNEEAVRKFIDKTGDCDELWVEVVKQVIDIGLAFIYSYT